MKLQTKFLWIMVSFICVSQANAVEIIDRSRPRALEQMSQLSAPAARQALPEETVAAPSSDKLEQRVAGFLKADDCPSIIATVPPGTYETVKPEVLSVLAYCEPPGKDPEKMFLFAEKKAPENDIVLLLHARYRWKKQRPDAEELFIKLSKQAKDPRLKALAREYVLGEQSEGPSEPRVFSYVLSGQVGGIQEGNPQGLAISDPSFGINSSTAGTAQLAVSLRRQFSTYLMGINYILNDTTYWRTHDADLLTNDFDFTFVRRFGDYSTIGVRPFSSLYLLQGTRYYSLYGVGLTGSLSTEAADYWGQASAYNDSFYVDEARDQGGSHLRMDWQITLKRYPLLQPMFFAYVDRAIAGVDLSSGRFIPYSHVAYAFGGAFNRLVHRYSVGLAGRMVYREDSQSTRLNDSNGLSVSKRRQDVQFVVQPNMTVPLSKGIDLFFYFESSSIASTLKPSDGLDRNISDNILGALIRMSLAN
jgi:hypothetical protein